jgi:hypothetical protein
LQRDTFLTENCTKVDGVKAAKANPAARGGQVDAAKLKRMSRANILTLVPPVHIDTRLHCPVAGSTLGGALVVRIWTLPKYPQ